MRLLLHHTKSIYRVMFSSAKMATLPIFGCLLLQIHWLGWVERSSGQSGVEILSYVCNSYAGIWMLCAPFLTGMAGNAPSNKHPTLFPTLPMPPWLRTLGEVSAVLLLAVVVRVVVWSLWWLTTTGSAHPVTSRLLGLQEPNIVQNLASVPLILSGAVTLIASHRLARFNKWMPWFYMLLWSGLVYLGIAMGWMSTLAGNTLISAVVTGLLLFSMHFRWDVFISNGRRRGKVGPLVRRAPGTKYLFLQDLLRASLRWALILLLPGMGLAWYVVAKGMSGGTAMLVCAFLGAAGATIVLEPSWKLLALFRTNENDINRPIAPLGAASFLPVNKHTLLQQIYTHGLVSTVLVWAMGCVLLAGALLFQNGALPALVWEDLLLLGVVPVFALGPLIAALLVYRAARARRMLFGMMFTLLIAPQFLVFGVFLWPSSAAHITSSKVGLLMATITLVFLLSTRLPYYLWPAEREERTQKA